MRLWEEVSDNRRKWSNVVRKILIVCVTNSQGCWMTSQIRVNHHCRVEFNCIYNSCFCFTTSTSCHHCSKAQAALVLGPVKMSISQVVAGYFSRDGRGAAAAPGHWKITYHASSALASADPLLLSWSCSPHRSTVWRSHSIPDTRTMSPLALLLVLGAASCSAQAATSAKLQSLLGNTGAK